MSEAGGQADPRPRRPNKHGAILDGLSTAVFFVVGAVLLVGCLGEIGASAAAEQGVDNDGGSGAVGAGGAGGGGQPIGGEAPADPCDGVDCGGNGSCADVGDDAICICDDGFHAEGLSCVVNPPPGPCEGVQCGVHASCSAGSCVCDGGYEGDPDVGCSEINPTEASVRAGLVALAEAELGYCEGTDTRPYMLSQPGLWCYDFVAWVYQQSSQSLPAPYNLPTYQANALPLWWKPEPGDLIKFNIQHYGMVKSVSPDGNTITTVEGNVNSCVMGRTVSLGSIEYFGSLDSVF